MISSYYFESCGDYWEDLDRFAKVGSGAVCRYFLGCYGF